MSKENELSPVSQTKPGLKPVESKSTLHRLFRSGSIEEVIKLSVLVLGEHSPYGAAQILQMHEDENGRWLLPRGGAGPWKDQRGHRLLKEDEPLAVVARESRPCFCIPSEESSTQGEIQNFYAIPIFDENSLIAIARVGFATATSIPQLTEQTIDSIVEKIELAILRAIRTEELELTRDFDQFFLECMTKESARDACDHFAQQAGKAMNASLLVRERHGSRMRLVGGYGPFYDAAAASQMDLPLHGGPLQAAVEKCQPTVVNDVGADAKFQQMRKHYAATPMSNVYKQVCSFAVFPISTSTTADATLTVFSKELFYFLSYRVRLLTKIGKELAILLDQMKEKQFEADRTAELDFLRTINPPLDQPNAYAALNSQVEKLRRATQADLISVFLQDELRPGRWVLRAQHGWHDPRWANAAWYEVGDGLTGSLLRKKTPTLIRDVSSFRKRKRMDKCKYHNSMFRNNNDEPYEMIALPLWFKDKNLGIITIYRSLSTSRSGKIPRLNAIRRPVLIEAARSLSAFVSALRTYDHLHWRDSELNRRQLVLDAIRNTSSKNKLLADFCRVVVEAYHFKYAAIHLSEDKEIHLRGSYLRDKTAPAAEHSDDERSALLQAFACNDIVEKRRPCADDPYNPYQVRFEQIVEQIFLPIKLDYLPVGVLELRWKGVRTSDSSESSDVLEYHDKHRLLKLTEYLGAELKRLQLQRSEARGERAQRALDAIALFLGSRYHDLINYADRLESCIEILEWNLERPKDLELLYEAFQAVQKQKEIFARARKLSSSISNASRSDLEHQRIHSLLYETLNKERKHFDDYGIDLLCEIDEVEAKVDGSHLLEIFENLLKNAIEALRKGGTLSVSLTTDTEGFFTVTFQDDGPGIAPSRLIRLLAGKFSQNSPKEGAGLFLSRLLCEIHRGSLDIDSRESHGTVARVRIPLNEDSVA